VAGRAGVDEDEEPIDERVEGAIEQINQRRDLMTEAQVALDGCRHALKRTEAHTNSELARLQDENASHLARLAAYELKKAQSNEAAQAADDAAAKHGQTGAKMEVEAARQARADSMRMAMELQSTFDSLVPYFVYRTVLEQELEEKREAVSAAQLEVQSARRRYNGSMTDLETLSLEIQTAKAERQRAQEEAKAEAKTAAAETAAAEKAAEVSWLEAQQAEREALEP